jgi:hypothetical protein
MGSCTLRFLADPPVVSRYAERSSQLTAKLNSSRTSRVVIARELTMSLPAASWLYRKHLWRRDLQHEEVEGVCAAKITDAGLDYGKTLPMAPELHPAGLSHQHYGTCCICSPSPVLTQRRSHHLRYNTR